LPNAETQNKIAQLRDYDELVEFDKSSLNEIKLLSRRWELIFFIPSDTVLFRGYLCEQRDISFQERPVLDSKPYRVSIA
jgi:hypothetical protein